MDGPLGSVRSHIFCKMVLTVVVNAAGRVTPWGLASVGLGCPPAAQPPWALGLLRPAAVSRAAPSAPPHRLTQAPRGRFPGEEAPSRPRLRWLGSFGKEGEQLRGRRADAMCASARTGPHAWYSTVKTLFCVPTVHEIRMQVKPAFLPPESMFFRPSHLAVKAGAFCAPVCMLRLWTHSPPPHR